MGKKRGGMHFIARICSTVFDISLLKELFSPQILMNANYRGVCPNGECLNVHTATDVPANGILGRILPFQVVFVSNDHFYSYFGSGFLFCFVLL